QTRERGHSMSQSGWLASHVASVEDACRAVLARVRQNKDQCRADTAVRMGRTEAELDALESGHVVYTLRTFLSHCAAVGESPANVILRAMHVITMRELNSHPWVSGGGDLGGSV